MLKVGLTGGIASGKSLVSEMFVRLGAYVAYADQMAHELMQPGQPVYEAVVKNFGKQILNPDGSVNRPRLAETAFGSPERGLPSRIEELNRIVHPAVVQRQDDWMEGVGRRDPSAVAIVEAALILEAGAAQRFDKLVVVTCRPEQRIERFARRMKVDMETARAEVTRRMAAQLPDEEKIKLSDFVIDNSGLLDATERQIESLYEKLREQASASAI